MTGPSLWVPTVLILVGLLWNNTRIDKLAEKIDALDGKFAEKVDKVEEKVDKVEEKLGGRIAGFEEKLGGRIARLEEKLGARIDRLEEKMDTSRADSHKDAIAILSAMTELHERVAVVETRRAS